MLWQERRRGIHPLQCLYLETIPETSRKKDLQIKYSKYTQDILVFTHLKSKIVPNTFLLQYL